ncbi:hypothetical protein BVRB_4g087240 [Beta vulgaris subsp. vulgaris]|nr:hypothetical protein BVRB_4g087240 [Beta vulgaris subsp. vulgaris]
MVTSLFSGFHQYNNTSTFQITDKSETSTCRDQDMLQSQKSVLPEEDNLPNTVPNITPKRSQS